MINKIRLKEKIKSLSMKQNTKKRKESNMKQNTSVNNRINSRIKESHLNKKKEK